MTELTPSIEALRGLLVARPPKGCAATDVVIERWHDGISEEVIAREAAICMQLQIPLFARGKQWRITHCGCDETDCLAIEGVEWN